MGPLSPGSRLIPHILIWFFSISSPSPRMHEVIAAVCLPSLSALCLNGCLLCLCMACPFPRSHGKGKVVWSVISVRHLAELIENLPITMLSIIFSPMACTVISGSYTILYTCPHSKERDVLVCSLHLGKCIKKIRMKTIKANDQVYLQRCLYSIPCVRCLNADFAVWGCCLIATLPSCRASCWAR